MHTVFLFDKKRNEIVFGRKLKLVDSMKKEEVIQYMYFTHKTHTNTMWMGYTVYSYFICTVLVWIFY